MSESTLHFDGEGQQNLDANIRNACAVAESRGIKNVIIYTSNGKGIEIALGLRKDFKIVAVLIPKSFTPPADKQIGIPEGVKASLEAAGGVVVHADNYPFNTLLSAAATGITNPNFLRSAFQVVSGGFPFVLQAALMACDGGAIPEGETAIVISADTAAIVTTARTENFLTHFVVNEIVAKPRTLSIVRKKA